MRLRCAIAALVALASIAGGGAHPAPPPGADLDAPLARWFRGLTVPGSRVSCCDQSDCRPTLARQRDGVWFADTPAGAEVMVPADRVLAGEAHPGGAAVLCWRPGQPPLCFVPPRAGG